MATTRNKRLEGRSGISSKRWRAGQGCMFNKGTMIVDVQGLNMFKHSTRAVTIGKQGRVKGVGWCACCSPGTRCHDSGILMNTSRATKAAACGIVFLCLEVIGVVHSSSLASMWSFLVTSTRVGGDGILDVGGLWFLSIFPLRVDGFIQASKVSARVGKDQFASKKEGEKGLLGVPLTFQAKDRATGGRGGNQGHGDVFGILMLSSIRGFPGVASPNGDHHGRAVSKGSNGLSGEASTRRVPELQRGAEL
jgi:hypothetical protein